MKIKCNCYFNSYLDAPLPWQMGFQDPASPTMVGIISFHNHLIFVLVGIGIFVFSLLYGILKNFKNDEKNSLPFFQPKFVGEGISRQFTHSTSLEIVWTILPALILMVIAGPSFALLYSIDEVTTPTIIIRVVGHQWYWSYEYVSVPAAGARFDSYIMNEVDIPKGGLRLLEVDQRVVLPRRVYLRLLVSSGDVLHSWAIPSLGIKIDACPGRLNQVSLFLLRRGVFYGQCSEICGINHGFIPIVVESVNIQDYNKWGIVYTAAENSPLRDPARVIVRDRILSYQGEILGQLHCKPIPPLLRHFWEDFFWGWWKK